MRRRGNKLFVQGSLHMQIEDNEKRNFTGVYQKIWQVL